MSEARTAANERIYQGIKRGIITNLIRPETILSENELAKQYGCSRTPAREALARLRHEGFVTLTPHKGNVVTRPSVRDIVEGYFLRCLLEGAAAELAATRWTSESMAALEACVTPASDSEVGPLNSRFHGLVAKIAGNESLKVLTLALLDQLERSIFLDPAMWNTTYLGEHQAIIAALKTRDPARAKAEMVKHVEASRSRVIGVI